MPDVPAAFPDKAKIRALIWERGYSINGFARRIGRTPKSLYDITGRNVPKRRSVKLLRQLAAGLSTPAQTIKVSDISDWDGDDDLYDPEPEPEALAS